MRAQLLSQLQKGQVLTVGPPPSDKPSLKRKALNSMIADYLDAAAYQYSLSVFAEEANTSGAPRLTEGELLDVLRIEQSSNLYQALAKAKRGEPQQGACLLLQLLEAIADLGHNDRVAETGTQTGGQDRYHLEVRDGLMSCAVGKQQEQHQTDHALASTGHVNACVAFMCAAVYAMH